MLTEGGGGVQEPPILADVIFEQPLTGILEKRDIIDYNSEIRIQVHRCICILISEIAVLLQTYSGGGGEDNDRECHRSCGYISMAQIVPLTYFHLPIPLESGCPLRGR